MQKRMVLLLKPFRLLFANSVLDATFVSLLKYINLSATSYKKISARSIWSIPASCITSRISSIQKPCCKRHWFKFVVTVEYHCLFHWYAGFLYCKFILSSKWDSQRWACDWILWRLTQRISIVIIRTPSSLNLLCNASGAAILTQLIYINEFLALLHRSSRRQVWNMECKEWTIP